MLGCNLWTLVKWNSALWWPCLLPTTIYSINSSIAETNCANMSYLLCWKTERKKDKTNTSGSCGDMATSQTIAKGTSYGSNCSKPLCTLSIPMASEKMSWMILAVNMIINYTRVRTNGLSQHERTSMLNWKTKGIIRGSIISLGYKRGLNSGACGRLELFFLSLGLSQVTTIQVLLKS